MQSRPQSELITLLNTDKKKVFNPETNTVELKEIKFDGYSDIDLNEDIPTHKNFTSTAASLKTAFQNNKRFIGISLTLATLILVGGTVVALANKVNQDENANNNENTHTNSTVTLHHKDFNNDNQSSLTDHLLNPYTLGGFIFMMLLIMCKGCTKKNQTSHAELTNSSQQLLSLPSIRNFGTFDEGKVKLASLQPGPEHRLQPAP